MQEEKRRGEVQGEIIFVGTGTSEGIPIVSCLTRGCETDPHEQLPASADVPHRCPVCFDAVRTDIRSPNHRRNTSLLIRWRPSTVDSQEVEVVEGGGGGGGCSARAAEEGAASGEGSGEEAMKRTKMMKTTRHRNVLIDCGKFFWPSALEWFPKYRVRFIDALLLTHRHNDACFGLDDMRDFTRTRPDVPLDVYLRDEDLTYLKQPFSYLVDTSTVRRCLSRDIEVCRSRETEHKYWILSRLQSAVESRSSVLTPSIHISHSRSMDCVLPH